MTISRSVNPSSKIELSITVADEKWGGLEEGRRCGVVLGDLFVDGGVEGGGVFLGGSVSWRNQFGINEFSVRVFASKDFFG